MTTSIGEIISRVKRAVKAYKPDAFITDKYIYSMLMKWGRMFMRRQDSANKVMTFDSLFQTLDFVELEEVDKVQAQCAGLSSDCTIKRTIGPLPEILDGYNGALIREVSSLDGSEIFERTTPNNYLRISRQKNFKYNKTRYYWFLNGYLYFPNLDWDSVKITAAFEEDVTPYNCDCDDSCIPKQEQLFRIPEFLHADMERMVTQEFGLPLQIPSDNRDDKQNLLR